MFGVFQDEQKREHVFIANNNAYAAQKVVIGWSGKSKAHHFVRDKSVWAPLEAPEATIEVLLQPGGGELRRFEK